jgi:hypothetical protein
MSKKPQINSKNYEIPPVNDMIHTYLNTLVHNVLVALQNEDTTPSQINRILRSLTTADSSVRDITSREEPRGWSDFGNARIARPSRMILDEAEYWNLDDITQAQREIRIDGIA